MLAIIGGTGLSKIETFQHAGFKRVLTPYSDKRIIIELYKHEGKKIAFLPRHGKEHSIPPHRINYRANIWALHSIGVNNILAISTVGGIGSAAEPGAIIIPDQIIDYTYNRSSTFYEDNLNVVTHIDFTYPFSKKLREQLKRMFIIADELETEKQSLVEGGVYGCTQGPRLETAAEIIRLKKDGCDFVGMTGMPEASLSRELKMNYAMLAISVNWAAGLGEGEVSLSEIKLIVKDRADFIVKLLKSFIKHYV